METDEWRVTSEIDHLVDFLQELTVILERVPPSPVLEDALKQTLCTVTLFKNYFKYTKANIASGGELAGETQATIDPFGDADGDKAYLPVLRLSRIQHSWMRGFYEKEYASEGAGLDKATMIDDMLEQLEYSARTLQQAVGMLILDVTSTMKIGQGKTVATTSWDKMNKAAENAEEQKRQAAQATHDVELKEKAHQIVKRVSEDRKEILTAVFGASTRFDGDDPCFPADAPVQKDRLQTSQRRASLGPLGASALQDRTEKIVEKIVGTVQKIVDPVERPNAACSGSKSKRVPVHAPNAFDYAASDGSALVSAEEPCTPPRSTDDSCLYKPDTGATRAGSVLVDETFAMVESTVKQCDDLSEELKKALGSSEDECTLEKVQVALDAWWGNVKTMGCGDQQPCLFDGALDLHLLSKLHITNTEDLIKLPLWTGFLGLPSTMERVAKGAGKYMLKKLWPFAPEEYEDAHEYLISVEADKCEDASGRWLTRCIGPNEVEPCKYLADKAIEVLWAKVREQQRRLDPSANSLLSPTAPSPSPSLPQVKQRRCDPLREYLDEIPPKSAAAVGTVDKPETVKEAEEDAHVEEEDARQEAKVTVNFVMDKKLSPEMLDAYKTMLLGSGKLQGVDESMVELTVEEPESKPWLTSAQFSVRMTITKISSEQATAIETAFHLNPAAATALLGGTVLMVRDGNGRMLAG